MQISQPAALYLPLGVAHVHDGVCSGFMGVGSLPWPLTIPVGFQVVIQTLSFTSVASGVMALSFSNAVEITAR